jgi:hypothetical protein
MAIIRRITAIRLHLRDRMEDLHAPVAVPDDLAVETHD